MKTKFYKRLVPIALIASMAVTNVGMTSAGAQEIVEAGKSITAPVVGTLANTDGVGGASAIRPIKVTTPAGGYKVTYSETDASHTLAHSGKETVDISLSGLPSDKIDSITNEYFIITSTTPTGTIQENLSAVTGVEVTGFTKVDSTSGKITLTIDATTGFGSSTSKTWYLAVLREYDGSANYATLFDDNISEKTITVAKEVEEYTGSNPGQDDPEPAGTADVFQIPGGLKASAKGGVKGYTVGVAKVIDEDAYEGLAETAEEGSTAAEKAAAKAELEVSANAAAIVEDTDNPTNDTTIGEWTGTYQGVTPDDEDDPALNLKPAPDGNLEGQYVLYYYPSADGTGDPEFVRLLSNEEKASLPYTWKTASNLTGKASTKGKAYTTGDDAEGENALLNAEVKAAILADLFGEDQEEFDATGDKKGYFNDKVDAVAKVDAKKYDHDSNGETAEITQPGQTEVPEITAVAQTASIVGAYEAAEKDAKKDTVLGKLIAAIGKTAFEGNAAYYTPADEEEETDAVITNAGYAALAAVLAADPEKYLAEDAHYLQVKARATAEYLNGLNDDIFRSGDHDLSSIVWVMETTKDSKDKTTVNGKDVYPATSSSAKFWGKSFAQKKVKGELTDSIGKSDASVAKTMGAKVIVSNTKAAGKFNAAVYIKGVTKDYTPAKKNKDMNGDVIFAEGFYVPPAVPSAFKEATLAAKNNANAFDLKTVTGFDKSKSEKTKFTLSIFSGKSYKLPFKLNDGQEKDLVYEVSNGSTGFTVVNGKVTGTDANGAELATSVDDFATKSEGKNVIKVYSRANPEVYALVQVQVLDAFKSIRANTTSLSVYPGSEQKVVLGTVPAMFGENYKYKITDGTGGKVDIGYLNDSTFTALEDGFIPAGFNTLVVKAKTGQEVAKGSKITVELWTTAATPSKVTMKKDLDIKVNPANAPQDIKTVKTGVKSKETKVLDDDSVVKVVNVPVGGSANLGYAVNPVAAEASISGRVVVNEPADSDGDVVSINGDVVTGNEEGTAVVTLSPDGGSISDTFKAKETDNEGTIKYFINVYTPGASIAFPEESDYTIKGGFLMSKAAAATDCDKNFTAFSEITMPSPKTSGGDEEIIWKANNNAAVKFVDNGETLTITPLQTGTFTITGTTKYTKQSLKFKLNVVAENPSDDASNVPEDGALSLVKDGVPFELYSAGSDANDPDDDTEQTVFSVGEKLNAYFGSGRINFGGKVKFTSSAPKVAAVNAGGIITAKGAGKATITATMTCGSKTVTKTFDITVSAIIPTIKSAKVAAGSVKGKAFKVSLGLNKFDKKTMTLEWYYSGEKADGTAVAETKLPGMTDNKLSGSATIADAGEYDIYAKIKVGSEYPYEDFEVTNTKFGQQEYVKIYESAINAINNNNGDADTKKAIAALGGKYDATNEKLKVNGRAGGDLYVPLFITEKGSDGKTVKATGTFDYDDFVWTTSNKSLANVEETLPITENYVGIEENDIIKNVSNASCVAHITLGQGTGVENVISGPVTIKGVCKNSNKTVTIKINVVAGEKALNAAYNPQKLEELATPGVTLANIDDSSVNADKLANGTTGDDKVKAAAANVKEGKTFKMVKYVLVNGSTLKTINADTEHLVFEPKVAEINKSGASKFTAGLAADSTASATNFLTAKTAKSVTAFPREGTWYLAVADVTYKVTKAHKDEVAADAANNVAAQEEVNLELDETALKVTKIVSKTPITKIEEADTVINVETMYSIKPNSSYQAYVDISNDVIEQGLGTSLIKLSDSKTACEASNTIGSASTGGGINPGKMGININENQYPSGNTKAYTAYVWVKDMSTAGQEHFEYSGVKINIKKFIKVHRSDDDFHDNIATLTFNEMNDVDTENKSYKFISVTDEKVVGNLEVTGKQGGTNAVQITISAWNLEDTSKAWITNEGTLVKLVEWDTSKGEAIADVGTDLVFKIAGQYTA